ncbi:MAG TPA: AI-2E family transporter [Candidatus Sulfotelmatobacter sp.]|nr:AI-2E family transporter [Candidatus Sulfotelmatobacter sp.]
MLTRGNLPENRWLAEIVFLLWVLALALVVVFCYFESSLCITLLLASFLAIVVDPLIMYFERWRIPRMVSSAVVILAGTAIVVSLAYASYHQVSDVVDDMPEYARRVGEIIKPITRKIEKVQDSAGRLSAEMPARKVPVVRVKQDYPEWTSYLIRGVGPMSGAIIIAGIVPFLMFFLLIQKNRLKQKLSIVWGERIDVCQLTSRVTQMVRGFVVGNLVIGLLMALVTVAVLLALKMSGAVILGTISGFINLVPFLGAIFAALVLVGAALVQNQPMTTLLAILAIVIALHTVSANYFIPHFIGRRVSISPVAATIGILFWGWLWGLIGVLLAVPLTAFVKIIADSHPSLGKIANLLAEKPVEVPPWSPVKPPDPAGFNYRAEPTHANK